MKVNINDYLPKYNTPWMPNRIWLWNLGKQLIKNDLINILMSVEFKQLIDSELEERQQYLITKRKFAVDVLLESKSALLSSKVFQVAKIFVIML